MSWQLEDPEEPPASASLRAPDLKNRPCIFRPVSLGKYDDKDGKAGSPYVACDVWVLDRMGVETEASNVFISWGRVYPVLKDKLGHLIGARPVEDGTAIILKKLEGEARTVAEKVVVELRSEAVTTHLSDDPNPEDFSDAPFTEDPEEIF